MSFADALKAALNGNMIQRSDTWFKDLFIIIDKNSFNNHAVEFINMNDIELYDLRLNGIHLDVLNHLVKKDIHNKTSWVWLPDTYDLFSKDWYVFNSIP